MHMSETVRDRILERAIVELAANGTEFFPTTKLCRELHIARSLINHHFGNQMGLIAEATVTSYERYVVLLRDAAASRDTPATRLDAWMKAQSEWFVAHRGIAVLLQMPHPKYAAVMRDAFAARLTAGFRFNMAVLGILVRDVNDDEVTPLDFDIASAPFEDVMGESLETMMRTASVGMSSMGAAVWAAGRTMPSRDLAEDYIELTTLAQHRRWVLQAIAPTP